MLFVQDLKGTAKRPPVMMNDDGVVGKEASKTVHGGMGLQAYDMKAIRFHLLNRSR